MAGKGKKYTVLVVDDEIIIRELIGCILSVAGYRSKAAANGREALELMELHSFDALITDICMPEVDGIVLTREVLARHGDLPIMVITGHPDQYISDSAAAAGAMEFIVKPFATSELQNRFDRMMTNFAMSMERKGHKG